MSSGPVSPTLKRAERKVLADLLLFRDSRNLAVISTRQLTQTTGIPQTSIRRAIDRLNELQLIRTVGGDVTGPGRHVVTVRQVPEPMVSSPKAGRS